MPRRILGLSVVALSLACNGGIGVTDASSYSSTTHHPSSDPSNGGSNSDSNSDPTTDGGSAGGSSTGTGEPGSTGDSTGAATTSLTSSPTTSASTGDTGEPGACVDVSSNDHGDCDAFLGYAYDGISCRAFAGCDCAPDCDLFFPSALDCATTCAAAGGCDEAAIHPAFLAMDPIEIGTYCDEVDACAVQDTDASNWLAALFPGLSCEGTGPCEVGQACQVQGSGAIEAAQWQQLCAASLLPNAELYCVVFGP